MSSRADRLGKTGRTRESDFCGGPGFRHKKSRDRESCSLSLHCRFWPVSVPNLTRFVAPFVHFARRALCHDSAVSPRVQGQDAGRHHPGLDKHLWIFDRHVVSDLISNTCESFDDMHAAGVDEAATSQPRRIVEINGVDDERIPFPLAYALPIERCEILGQRAPRATIRGDVAVFVVAATVIGVDWIEEDDVDI